MTTSDDSRRLLPTTGRDWKDTGDLSKVPENSLLPRVVYNLNESTSSPAGSPAAASPPPESARDSGIPRLHFGVSSSDSYGSFDLATALSKTSQPSLLCTEESVSTRSFPGWPRAGIAVGGTCYPRAPLAPLTGGSGCSLLPTIQRSDGERGPDYARRNREGSGGDDLTTAMHSLMPTPTSAPWRTGGTGAEQTAMKRGLGLLPTPTKGDGVEARNATANRSNPESQHHSGTTLTDAMVPASTGAPTDTPSSDGKPSPGQRLSPWFVEWMMGAPPGFTDPDCPLSATEFKSKSPSWWGE